MDTQAVRERLETERRRLVGILESQPGPEEDVRAPGDVADQAADAASHIFDREVKQSVAERAEADIAEIDAALRRLDEGTYGFCQVGGERIPDARLEALPATRYCVEHREQVEREKKVGGYEGADPTL